MKVDSLLGSLIVAEDELFLMVCRGYIYLPPFFVFISSGATTPIGGLYFTAL